MAEGEIFVGTWTDAALVNNVLLNEGIETVVVSSNVSPRTLRSVCVLDAGELERARDIVQRYRTASRWSISAPSGRSAAPAATS